MPEMKTWTANGVAYEIVDAKAREDAAKAYSPDNKPTAADVGARPSTWMPTASDVDAVSISGGTMSGDIDMNNHRITGLPLPESGSEPATRAFVENFSVEGSTYVATDDNKDGNIVLRPYVADVDELVVGGHINNKENPHGVTAEQVGAAPAIEDATYAGCYYRMVGDEREWINPPMALGEEYRTTERLDKLVVYTKMTSFGEMPHNSSKTVQNVVANGSIFFVDGIVFNADGIPIVTFATNQSVSCDFAGRHVSVETTWDFNNCTAYLIVKYYKG
jgi:hypothetical protein